MTWPDLTQREIIGEMMDDPGLAEGEHVKALAGLRRINALSRTAPTLFRALLRLLGSGSARPCRVLDVACGDGENTLRLAELARRRGLSWRLEGCDLSDRAVDRARSLAASRGINARFFQADALSDLPASGYDAVVNSLFLHHLQGDQIVRLLSALRGARHVVISDLVRSRRAYLTTCVGVRLLSRSQVVHVDGPLSVRAALTVDELRALAACSALAGACVTRCWPMRQLLTWSSPA